MPLTDDAMQDGATAITDKYNFAQSHFDDPGSINTANINTGPRIDIDWTAPTGPGNFNLNTPILFTGIAANNPVEWVTIWSASTGGTCGGKWPVPVGADTAANSSGEYSLTAIPLNGVAT